MFHTQPKLSHYDREYNNIFDVQHDVSDKKKYRNTRYVCFVAHSACVSARVWAFHT
jgi:hypothetical protein